MEALQNTPMRNQMLYKTKRERYPNLVVHSFYEKYKGSIYCVLYKLTKNDLVSLTLLKQVYQALQHNFYTLLLNRENIAIWLHKKASDLAIDYLSKKNNSIKPT